MHTQYQIRSYVREINSIVFIDKSQSGWKENQIFIFSILNGWLKWILATRNKGTIVRIHSGQTNKQIPNLRLLYVIEQILFVFVCVRSVSSFFIESFLRHFSPFLSLTTWHVHGLFSVFYMQHTQLWSPFLVSNHLKFLALDCFDRCFLSAAVIVCVYLRLCSRAACFHP